MSCPPAASPPLAFDVVVAGYLCVDLALGFPRRRKRVALADCFRPGKLVEVEGLTFSLGGVVANTGLALNRFNRRVALMAAIGSDSLGDLVVQRLEATGVAVSLRRRRRQGTPFGVVVAPPGVDRIFFEDPGCSSTFTLRDLDLATVARSQLFHFGYPPLMRSMWTNGGRACAEMFCRIRRLGVATSLDLTLPDPDGAAGAADWEEILAKILPHVDIFAPSIEELLFMLEPKRHAALAAGGGDLVDAIPTEVFDRLGDRILALGVSILMIKAGHRGAYLRTADTTPLGARTKLGFSTANWSHRRFWSRSFPVDARRMRNANGAGDCAVAGFLAALLDGAEIDAAARYAMLAGRDNLYGVDAVSGLSSWKTMSSAVGAERTVPSGVKVRAASATQRGWSSARSRAPLR